MLAAAAGLAAGQHRPIYEHRFDAPNDELTGVLGGTDPNAPKSWRFSIEVATAWENAAQAAARSARTRLVLLRSAIIMSPDRGGAFDLLLKLVRFGLGGRNGSGRQYVSWIHEEDFARAVFWLIEQDSLRGASTWRRRIRSQTPRSCALCGALGACRSVCPRPNGCWNSARSFSAPRPN
jgi:nucleoside-diphosphate-sugar epimerase